ncbi:helix-turn-helix transcriptional regulator [Psychrobacillus sp. FSL K6-2843]|uniref:helix-turn-helix transcriptional regulator n=1 Tax=Psychrobacillus sp. FSL K6-2843 TaxID=2921549 RepID=UPI003159CB06
MYSLLQKVTTEVIIMLNIAELRARHGKMTQKQLAEKIGSSQTSISLWEKDINTISMPYLIKVCKYFGVSADDILGLRDI